MFSKVLSNRLRQLGFKDGNLPWWGRYLARVVGRTRW